MLPCSLGTILVDRYPNRPSNHGFWCFGGVRESLLACGACGTCSVAARTSPPPPPHCGTADPGVVKQDKSSGGSVDTTKTHSDPQRVRMSSGERPIGAAKGKQSDTEALCPNPPLRSPVLQFYWDPPCYPATPATPALASPLLGPYTAPPCPIAVGEGPAAGQPKKSFDSRVRAVTSRQQECHARSAHTVRSFGCRQIPEP